MNYGFSTEQIENRVLASCNQERLKEHRQCYFCHMVCDCKYYKSKKGITLCQFLDDYLKEGK